MLARFGCPCASTNTDHTSSPHLLPSACCFIGLPTKVADTFFLPSFSCIHSFLLCSFLFFSRFILFISVSQRQNKQRNMSICMLLGCMCVYCVLCMTGSSFDIYKHIAKCAICICYSNEFYACDGMVTTFIDMAQSSMYCVIKMIMAMAMVVVAVVMMMATLAFIFMYWYISITLNEK